MSDIGRDASQGVGNGKSPAGTVSDAATAVLEGAQRKAADVAGRVREAGGQAADYVRDQYGHLSDQAQNAYTQARETAQEWERSAEGYVQRSPVKAVIIAASVGLLVGLLIRRS